MILSRTEIDTQSVAGHYNDLDPFYREIWGKHVHHGLWSNDLKQDEADAAENLIRLVAHEAQITRDRAEICDVGCGYGETARFLSANFGARVTGVTLSKSQYRHAKALSEEDPNLSFYLNDWLENGFESESFDRVISIECLAHIPDKQKYFTEIYRVLRPKGGVVICAWLSERDPSLWKQRYLLEPICSEGRLPSMGTARDYLKMARKAGMSVERFSDLSNQVKQTWSICAKRTLGKLATQSKYRSFLWKNSNPNRHFAKSLMRIWAAYQTGAMRYGLFTFSKN